MKKLTIASLMLFATTTLFANTKTTFQTMTDSYGAIRHALAADSMTNVNAQATAIATAADASLKKFDAKSFGVTPDGAAKAKAQLANISTHAKKVAASKDLKTARDAFAGLSTAMIEIRNVAAGAKPAVAFCSMAKSQWLQPDANIENPFLGPKMAKCGEVTSSATK
jgi:hypothetical protein